VEKKNFAELSLLQDFFQKTLYMKIPKDKAFGTFIM